jgi:hypothetical protein
VEEMSDQKRLVVVSGITLVLLALLSVFVVHVLIDLELSNVCWGGHDPIKEERCDDWLDNIKRQHRREMYECFFIDRPNGSIDTKNCLKEKGLEPPTS